MKVQLFTLIVLLANGLNAQDLENQYKPGNHNYFWVDGGYIPFLERIPASTGVTLNLNFGRHYFALSTEYTGFTFRDPTILTLAWKDLSYHRSFKYGRIWKLKRYYIIFSGGIGIAAHSEPFHVGFRRRGNGWFNFTSNPLPSYSQITKKLYSDVITIPFELKLGVKLFHIATVNISLNAVYTDKTTFSYFRLNFGFGRF